MLFPLSEKLQNPSEKAFFWQTRAAREAVEKFDTAWQELRYQNRGAARGSSRIYLRGSSPDINNLQKQWNVSLSSTPIPSISHSRINILEAPNVIKVTNVKDSVNMKRWDVPVHHQYWHHHKSNRKQKTKRNSHTTGSNTQPAKGEGADTTSPDASSAQAIPLRPYVLWTPLPPE